MGYSNHAPGSSDRTEYHLTSNVARFVSDPSPGPSIAGAEGFLIGLDTASRACRSALIVVDPNGWIRWQNAGAAALLAAGDVLGVRGGCLFIDRASIQRTFIAHLKSLVEAGSADNLASVATGIPDRNGAIRYALNTISVATRAGATEILLSIVDFDDRSGPSRSTFASVFRFSTREAELAELFARGLTLEDIAVEMGVAMNTIRVHLRSIFFKTNCSGQTALMRILSRLI